MKTLFGCLDSVARQTVIVKYAVHRLTRMHHIMKSPRTSLRFAALAGTCWLASFIPGACLRADEQPVSILAARIGGHIHPSICRTQNGTLVVVYKGENVLMCARSSDDGASWSNPEPIATSAKRPEAIREVRKFEVYPGTVDSLPDDRILVTWNYIADDKPNDGYYERALLYTISTDQGRTWSDQQLIGPVDGKHLGAVRHNVLSWSNGRWLRSAMDYIPTSL